MLRPYALILKSVRLTIELSGQIYIFDELTTGLHFSDVERLIGLLNELVERGSTVIVIEHNLEVMTQADWIIDLGPEAGDLGGQIVFEGTASQLLEQESSITGKFLRSYLHRNPSQTPGEGAAWVGSG